MLQLRRIDELLCSLDNDDLRATAKKTTDVVVKEIKRQNNSVTWAMFNLCIERIIYIENLE